MRFETCDVSASIKPEQSLIGNNLIRQNCIHDKLSQTGSGMLNFNILFHRKEKKRSRSYAVAGRVAKRRAATADKDAAIATSYRLLFPSYETPVYIVLSFSIICKNSTAHPFSVKKRMHYNATH